MRKISTLYTMALLLTAAFAFSSCSNDDEDMAYYLDGVWKGSIYDGNQVYDATLEFEQRNGNYFSTSGYGYEEDCTWTGHVSRTQFRWYVRNRFVYLDYGPDGVYILDCSNFPNSSFIGEHMSGKIWHERSQEHVANFRLRKKYNHSDY